MARVENTDEAEALLVEEYDADASMVEESLTCGFAEAIAEFIDRGVREPRVCAASGRLPV